MTFSQMRVDMRIRHRDSGLKATIGEIKNGKFRIVDENGEVEEYSREFAPEWEQIR